MLRLEKIESVVATTGRVFSNTAQNMSFKVVEGVFFIDKIIIREEKSEILAGGLSAPTMVGPLPRGMSRARIRSLRADLEPIPTMTPNFRVPVAAGVCFAGALHLIKVIVTHVFPAAICWQLAFVRVRCSASHQLLRLCAESTPVGFSLLQPHRGNGPGSE
jgi:cyanate permease